MYQTSIFLEFLITYIVAHFHRGELCLNYVSSEALPFLVLSTRCFDTPSSGVG